MAGTSAAMPTIWTSSSAKADDPVLRGVSVHHKSRGVLDTPPSRGMTEAFNRRRTSPSEKIQFPRTAALRDNSVFDCEE
jgi:hypothetical protein